MSFLQPVHRGGLRWQTLPLKYVPVTKTEFLNCVYLDDDSESDTDAGDKQ